MTTRRFALGLAGLAGLALVLRLLQVVVAGPHAGYGGDAFFYSEAARLLADGRGYLDPFALVYQHRVTASAAHPPLWSTLLAPFAWVGLDGTGAQRVIGCGLGAGVTVLVGLLGRRLGGERAGLWAAGLAALYVPWIVLDGSLMSETLAGGLVAIVLLAALAWRERPTRGRTLAVGVALALATLARQEAGLLVLLLAVPLMARTPRALALCVVACLVVIAPWTIRNAVAFRAFVPVSTNDGALLAGGNCDRTYHGPETGAWFFFCVPPSSERNEAVRAAGFRSQGLHYAREHLGRVPVVAAARLGRTFGLWAPTDFGFGSPERRDRTLDLVGVVLWYAVVVAAAFGAARLPGRTRWLLLAPVAAVALSTLPSAGNPRFRHIAEVPLLALAGVTAAQAAAAVSRSRRRETTFETPSSPIETP